MSLRSVPGALVGCLIGGVRGFRLLTPGDRGPFLRAWWQLILARVGLRIGPVRRRMIANDILCA